MTEGRRNTLKDCRDGYTCPGWLWDAEMPVVGRYDEGSPLRGLKSGTVKNRLCWQSWARAPRVAAVAVDRVYGRQRLTGGFAGASSTATAGGFCAVPGGVFEGVAELFFGSAFAASSGGFGSVWRFDSPVAVAAFFLAFGEHDFFDRFFFDLCSGVCAGARFSGGHGSCA